MKQSHHMRCEIVVPTSNGGGKEGVARELAKEIQERLDKGWTLRAAPVMNGQPYLIFVRKEAK